MATLLGFLSVIASHLLRMTYLHRNSPDSPAVLVLTPVQIDVLLALSPAQLKNSGNLTIDWALRAIARLGGYARTSAKNCNWHPSVMARMVATRVSMPWLAVTPGILINTKKSRLGSERELKIGGFFGLIIFMPKPEQLPPLEDLQQRTDQLIKILELLEQEIQEVLATGKVA